MSNILSDYDMSAEATQGLAVSATERLRYAVTLASSMSTGPLTWARATNATRQRVHVEAFGLAFGLAFGYP